MLCCNHAALGRSIGTEQRRHRLADAQGTERQLQAHNSRESTPEHSALTAHQGVGTQPGEPQRAGHLFQPQHAIKRHHQPEVIGTLLALHRQTHSQ